MSRPLRLPFVFLAGLGAAVSAVVACGSDDDGAPPLVETVDAGPVDAAPATQDAGTSPDSGFGTADPIEPTTCTCQTPEVAHISADLPCGAALCVGIPGQWTEYKCFDAGGAYVDPPVDCLDASVTGDAEADR